MEHHRDAQGVTRTPKLLLTVAETTHVLSISRSKLYELLTAGVIESVKIDGSRLIPMKSLETYVSNLIEEAA